MESVSEKEKKQSENNNNDNTNNAHSAMDSDNFDSTEAQELRERQARDLKAGLHPLRVTPNPNPKHFWFHHFFKIFLGILLSVQSNPTI